MTTSKTNTSVVDCYDSDSDVVTVVIKAKQKRQPRKTIKVARRRSTKNRKKSEPVYEVEHFLKCEIIDGKTKYLIKWKNFDDTHNTWESEEMLISPELKEIARKKFANVNKDEVENNKESSVPVADDDEDDVGEAKPNEMECIYSASAIKWDDIEYGISTDADDGETRPEKVGVIGSASNVTKNKENEYEGRIVSVIAANEDITRGSDGLVKSLFHGKVDVKGAGSGNQTNILSKLGRGMKMKPDSCKHKKGIKNSNVKSNASLVAESRSFSPLSSRIEVLKSEKLKNPKTKKYPKFLAVLHVKTEEDENNKKKFKYLVAYEYGSGCKTSYISDSVARAECPQQLIQFFEERLTWS